MDNISQHHYFYILFSFCITLILSPVNAQVFNWCDDGYLIGGGLYQDIDNSGIDVEVSGLVDESCAILYGQSIVITGINDQGIGGVQHEYKFVFSETLNVSFYVYDANYGNEWNDQLIFSEDPIIYYQSLVTVSGDTVFPAFGSSLGHGVFGVRFENIDSLIITHGSGIDTNPGYIYITELVFGDSWASLDEFSELTHQLQFTENGMKITGISSPPSNVDVLSGDGRIINSTHLYENEEIQVSFENLPIGIYYFQIELKNGQLVRDKFIIR